MHRSLTLLGPALRVAAFTALAGGPMALAGIYACASAQELRPGQRCQLTATRAGEVIQNCTWTLPSGAILAPDGNGLHHFTAPPGCAGGTIQLRVSAPGQAGREFAILPIRLLPTLTPQLSLFAGWERQAPPPADQDLFRGVSTIRFLEPEQALGDLGGKWLVAGERGVLVVSQSGAATPLAGAPEQDVMALAVRPKPAAGDPHPVRAVFAQRRAVQAEGLAVSHAWTLHALAVDGSIVQLEPWEGDGSSLARRLVSFGAITGLAMGADGTIFVADGGRQQIRKVALDGMTQTLTLAGSTPAFQSLKGLALHPDSGDLFVADGSQLHRVSQSGQVKRVLGQPWPDLGASLIAPSLLVPQDLQLHGQHLFIADSGLRAILIFSLTTGSLQTPVGEPDSQQERMGALRFYAPGSEGPCAALAAAHSVGVAQDGTCLIGLCHGLGKLDWSTEPPDPWANAISASSSSDDDDFKDETPEQRECREDGYCRPINPSASSFSGPHT